MKIAINGAGIAGPTLAYWLAKEGHEVVLLEQAPGIRTGGYIIDFWGLGYDIAEKMGLLPQVRDLGYEVQEVSFVDRRGRKNGGFMADVFRRMTDGRFTSIARSDVARIIYDALENKVETVFGDSIAQIDETEDGVRLSFEQGAARRVDLVIGADGLHSRVRQLVFGSDAWREVSLGYHVAAFEVRGYRPREELVYVSHGAPGRQISRFSKHDNLTLFLLVFRDEFLRGTEPEDDAARKAALVKIFDGTGWEWPQISAALQQSDDLYFDRVSQIKMERWTKGRVALIGDAAACVSLLAGEGSGLAMTEAYVLAGELSRASGDYTAAFARYEQQLMPFIRRKQEAAGKFASSFAPKTRLGLAFRNAMTRLMRIPFVANFFAGDLRDDFQLPAYETAAGLK